MRYFLSGATFQTKLPVFLSIRVTCLSYHIEISLKFALLCWHSSKFQVFFETSVFSFVPCFLCYVTHSCTFIMNNLKIQTQETFFESKWKVSNIYSLCIFVIFNTILNFVAHNWHKGESTWCKFFFLFICFIFIHRSVVPCSYYYEKLNPKGYFYLLRT